MKATARRPAVEAGWRSGPKTCRYAGKAAAHRVAGRLVQPGEAGGGGAVGGQVGFAAPRRGRHAAITTVHDACTHAGPMRKVPQALDRMLLWCSACAHLNCTRCCPGESGPLCAHKSLGLADGQARQSMCGCQHCEQSRRSAAGCPHMFAVQSAAGPTSPLISRRPSGKSTTWVGQHTAGRGLHEIGVRRLRSQEGCHGILPQTGALPVHRHEGGQLVTATLACTTGINRDQGLGFQGSEPYKCLGSGRRGMTCYLACDAAPALEQSVATSQGCMPWG